MLLENPSGAATDECLQSENGKKHLRSSPESLLRVRAGRHTTFIWASGYTSRCGWTVGGPEAHASGRALGASSRISG